MGWPQHAAMGVYHDIGFRRVRAGCPRQTVCCAASAPVSRLAPRVYEAMLTSADAMAWEALPRDGSRRELFLAIGLAIVLGMALGLMPDDWTEGWRFYAIGLSFCVLGFCLWTVAKTLSAYGRARRRIPAPTPLRVTQGPDGFGVTTDQGTCHYRLAAIATVTPTATHLFLAGPEGLVILPLAAFESPEDMAATGLAIEAALAALDGEGD